jgi:hypothetical protein
VNIRGRYPAAFGVLLLALVLFGPAGLQALEINDGLIRLVLHELTGRFSLYYLTDPMTESYEPLFTHQDPRTSFLAVNRNGSVYRLGENPAFAITIEKNRTNPAIVFTSPFMRIRQEFVFIKTAGSLESNGIKMTVSVKNMSPDLCRAGLRVLIDTNLGESPGAVPFVTNTRSVTAETLISGESERDLFWISRNRRLALMGSIFAGPDAKPDLVHFANWKRLNDLPWKIGYSQGRNFNYPPYSTGDSAVCYYYEPAALAADGELRYAIFLAAEDPGGFVFREEISPGQREADLAMLRELMARLDQFIAGEIRMSPEEIADMEQAVNRFKARYQTR